MNNEVAVRIAIKAQIRTLLSNRVRIRRLAKEGKMLLPGLSYQEHRENCVEEMLILRRLDRGNWSIVTHKAMLEAA